MKKLPALLFFALTFTIPAFALSGGPWDGNVPGNPILINPANINGTYQGTVKGHNISGITVFSNSSVGTTGTAGSTTTIVTGTGANRTITTITSPSTTQGYAVVFIEGKVATAELLATVDLSGRKISAIMEGSGLRGIPMTLSNAAGRSWSVIDSVLFNGTFTAKLAEDWPANSYRGKGKLVVTKVDLEGFARDLATKPAGSVPQVVTRPTTVKFSGVKTTDQTTSFFINLPNPTTPSITEIFPE